MYQSRVVSSYRVDFHLLRRLRVFGAIKFSRSPYASIFGCSISQNLTYRPVVPDDSPAFKVIMRYCRLLPTMPNCYEDIMKRCSQDLRLVFQSGQGSPYDTLPNGTIYHRSTLFSSPSKISSFQFRVFVPF